MRDEVRAAVERVLGGGSYILGREVEAFEREWARFCGVAAAAGVANGTDALALALVASDAVRPGRRDEVITAPLTAGYTALGIVNAGAVPVFADVDPDTYTLDPRRLERALTPRTRAVVPVHLYGRMSDVEAVCDFAARRGLVVVEDAAQAHGARLGRRRAGAWGHAAAFSFYPTKNLGAAGEAGLVTTNEQGLAERLRRLRVHGGATEYHHDEVGFNSRLDTFQAAVLRVKLPHLDTWSDARRERADTYTRLIEEAGLTEFVAPPFVIEGARHIFHQYVVRVAAARRDALLEHLKAHGVGTKVYYPVPLHLQPCFADLGYKEGDFPESERAARETLALPMFPELTRAQQEYVVETLRRFFN